MKAVVFYEPGTASMEAIMAVYPRHKVLVDAYAARGEVLAIGTFAGGKEGSMGVFKSREAAEAFVKEDPFVLEGLVGKYAIKDWNEILLK
jgi:uncharacterized protein YciI